MTFVEQAQRRPLPSLAQWLGEKGRAQPAEGFELLVALRDLAEREIARSDGNLIVEQACFLRLWQGFLIATVELCNLEHANRVPPEIVLIMLPRVLAQAAMYAYASVAPDDAEFRDIAKLFTEEFRAATKIAADALSGMRP